MKKILVPIDFSDYSINAFRLATHIARIKGMSIKLLHVIERTHKFSDYFKKNDEEYHRKIEEHTREHLQRLVSLEHAAGLNADYEVRRSKAGIAKELLKEECDVIIMGRRRLENDQVAFFGSVAEKLVRLSPIPVMTVGELPENFGIKTIVYASDFEEEEQAPIIQRVIDLATIFSAKLHFLNVTLNRDLLSVEKSRERLIYRASKFDLQGHDIQLYVADTQEAGINQFIIDSGADLLALCTHGRNAFANFFIGSIAENMTAFAPIPVVTYNINKKMVERTSRPITREKVILRNKPGKTV